MKRLICTLLLGLAVVVSAAPRKRHLMIFVGENNMESVRPERTVLPVLKKDKELRKSELLWVREARRTMSMHDLDEGWRDSEGKAKKKLGPDYKVKKTKDYKRLLENAKQAARKKECDTVILYWMVGETDAQKGWGDQYEASFKRFIKQFEEDLGLGKIHVVITRLSDYGIENKKYPDWQKVRKAQEKLVKDNKGWVLVSTDDYNGKTNKLQFDKKGLEALGDTYAEIAMKFLGSSEAKKE
ncbi:sialate O-acetylesterase [Rubritalea tangerina]|uniref:Sialate O-acetylesterase n=1 Tax=Rubritalea tangerina TaxID=430798 RepID=A0ABW4ZBK3_9BACT